MRDRRFLTTAGAVALAILTATVAAAVENEPPPAGQVPAPNPPPTPAPNPPPAAVTILNSREVEGILGRQVRSSADEDMGRIVDVMVDRGGHVRAAIIDFGGFLGVGSRKIAVEWNALRFSGQAKDDQITLELTRDQVKPAPEYQAGKPVVILGAMGSLQSLPYP